MRESAAEMVFQEFPVFVYSDADACRACGRVLDATQAVAPDDLEAPVFDVCATLDGAIVASDAFRAACAGFPGAIFTPIGNLDGWSLLDTCVTVELDPFSSRVRTGTTCPTCSGPRYVVRDGALRISSEASLPRGISGTDVEFGDTADFGAQPIRLRPHLLVDAETRAALKAAGLLGVHFVVQPWEPRSVGR